MKKILISTGGSGGHVIPAMCLFDHFKENFNVNIVTDVRGSKYLDNKIYPFEIINVPNLFSKLYLFPFNLLFFIISIIKSFYFLKQNNIDYLFSTGGYMSVPICLASRLLNIKVYLFEPNMVIGRANKLILNYSNKIICYSSLIKKFPKKFNDKIYLIQPLLRKEIYDFEKNLNTEFSDTLRILILGGSQGSIFFDKMAKYIILELSKYYKIELTQQVYNKKIIQELKQFYDNSKITNYLISFDNNLYKKTNKFDIAITRSGASAISELSYFNVPFISIPFPAAKDDHQYFNAKYYSDKNCCWIIRQNEADPKKIGNFIKNLIYEKKDYFEKKDNLKKISYQNTWNNINQKLINLINEN